MVKASDCGSEDRGFDPHYPPALKSDENTLKSRIFVTFYVSKFILDFAIKKIISSFSVDFRPYLGCFTSFHFFTLYTPRWLSERGLLNDHLPGEKHRLHRSFRKRELHLILQPNNSTSMFSRLTSSVRRLFSCPFYDNSFNIFRPKGAD